MSIVNINIKLITIERNYSLPINKYAVFIKFLFVMSITRFKTNAKYELLLETLSCIEYNGFVLKLYQHTCGTYHYFSKTKLQIKPK